MRRSTFTFVATVVFFCWLLQFVGHQIWRYYPMMDLNNPAAGIPVLLALLLLAFLPAVFMARNAAPPHSAAQPGISNHWRAGSRNWFLTISIIALALLNWAVFAREAAFFPLHVYGDEFFHSQRTTMVRDYIGELWAYFGGERPNAPFHSAHFIFYPSLAYLANATFSGILGDAAALANQRLALVPHFLVIAAVTFAGALVLSCSRRLAFFMALLPASAPLLLSYTMSFYIELQYVAVYLLSAFLLHQGMEEQDERAVWAALLIASVGPIIRESSMPLAMGIGGGGVAYLLRKNLISGKLNFRSAALALYPLVVVLTPFLLFYAAKSAYSDWDQTRIANANILKQDYGALVAYSVLYLSPAWPILAIAALFTKRFSDRVIVVAMCASIGGALLLYARFLPGYMPWTRNYLMFYAPILVLMIIGAAHLYRSFGRKPASLALPALLGTSVLFNVIVSSTHLKNDVLFHESEAVFNDDTVTDYIRRRAHDFAGQTIYGQHPVFKPSPALALKDAARYEEVPSLAKKSQFFPFSKIVAELPAGRRYLLFHYFQNRSRPAVFAGLPAAKRPTQAELKGFRILAESSDPWSAGHTGTLLLERIQSTANNSQP